MTKLSKYYSRTDLTDVYACATMVDPSLKFSYWEEQDWETNIIEAQISQCKRSFSLFLTDYYAHELSTSDSSEALAFRVGTAIPTTGTFSSNDGIENYNVDDSNNDEDEDEDDDNIIGISKKKTKTKPEKTEKSVFGWICVILTAIK
ncbi:hypothetical protein BDF21DRAFT_405092 [Thamnidium elegans]|nr:hypothetical protein BDF21DRAFT_405092 [Thamnidium elegans]